MPMTHILSQVTLFQATLKTGTLNAHRKYTISKTSSDFLSMLINYVYTKQIFTYNILKSFDLFKCLRDFVNLLIGLFHV